MGEGPLDRDAEQLRRLGYAQQLLRDMGGFANFAISFSIISVLTGAVTLYGHGLRYGGPLAMTLGWPLVSLLTLPVAASLAQLASSYPTAGALYHWASLLGGRGAGFFTAWLNCIGQFAITAGIDYGLAQFVAALLGLPPGRAVLAVYAAVLVSHAVLNHLGVRLVARLNDLSAWVHIAGVAVIAVALAAFAPRQPAEFLLTRFTDAPRPYWLGFLLGLLQAGWTFTGFDASAHVSEETRDPTRTAPWGIFLSVAVSALADWVLLLAVTLAIGDLGAAAAADNPFVFVLRAALGTIALYASYGLPIFVGLRARRSGRWTRFGPWHLGRWSTPVNVAALVWIGTLTVLFVLPPNQVAGYTFGGALALLGAYWFFWMRARFKGPPVREA